MGVHFFTQVLKLYEGIDAKHTINFKQPNTKSSVDAEGPHHYNFFSIIHGHTLIWVQTHFCRTGVSLISDMRYGSALQSTNIESN